MTERDSRRIPFLQSAKYELTATHINYNQDIYPGRKLDNIPDSTSDYAVC